jgi:hypothetical protein
MTWKGLPPIVQWVTTTYERGKDNRCSSALPKVCSEPTAPSYGRADDEWVCW